MEKTTFKTILAAVLLLFALNRANAQEVPQALSDLMRLEGHWEGQATLILEGKTYTFPYHTDFKKTADGSGLLMEEWFSSEELGKLMGTNLIGYNANGAKIHWFSVDNFGTTHDHTGTWKSREYFYMETTEMMQKKKYKEKIDLIFKGNDTLELSLSATLDGKEYEKVSVVFQRVQKGSN